jgi:hypothetical protein
LFAATMLAALTLGLQLLVLERLLGRLGDLAQAAAVLVSVALGAYVYFRTTRKSWRQEHADLAREDLAGGIAEVTRYRARAAIRLEELEDEGPSFFVELADGRVLFLCGQFLYEDDEAGTFPCEEFEAARAPRTGLLLDFRCLGPAFPPQEKLPPFDPDEYDGPSIPDEWEIIDRSLEQILEERRARASTSRATSRPG